MTAGKNFSFGRRITEETSYSEGEYEQLIEWGRDDVTFQEVIITLVPLTKSQ